MWSTFTDVVLFRPWTFPTVDFLCNASELGFRFWGATGILLRGFIQGFIYFGGSSRVLCQRWLTPSGTAVDT